MAPSASSELSSLRRFARRYLIYGTVTLLVLLIFTEVAAPRIVEWFRTTPQELLWLRVPFALYAFTVGLWTRLHLWALLVPVVLYLFRWVDVRSSFRRGLWWSLALGVPIAAVHVAVEQGVFTLADFTREGVYPDFTTSFVRAEPYDVEDWPLAVLLFRRFMTDYFTYFILAALGFAYEHFVRSREQEAQAQALQAELAQAQLQALRMQVNPHFLFNTLNAIAVLVRGGETTKAGRTLRLLSDLLRSTFEGADVQMVPLREEIDLVERYLEIEEIRFGDRLRVDIAVDPDVSEVPVPYLLLQPLVENAVRHGVAPHAEAGVVRVTADPLRRDGQPDQVELTVADSGAGFPDTDVDVLSSDDGVGLSNTKRRLETLYGEKHTFDLGTAAEGGARITIRLPVDPEARTFEVDEASTAVPTSDQ
ncbi:histidine kinase [Salinibacter sp. 10B]|uniref:sensor histidine kinase n=1 Tax=Salinibacter sp. 10B TaxID=1923971 RepID=UPI000CF478E0|nr:histidine kinase [Salinibacter sp. 10B]